MSFFPSRGIVGFNSFRICNRKIFQISIDSKKSYSHETNEKNWHKLYYTSFFLFDDPLFIGLVFQQFEIQI